MLGKQRDLYAYLHDQTLRLLNQGLTGAEIAELVELPPEPRPRVALPRVLRLDQPQREGDLPALHGLVRRQPGPPLGAPAGRAGAPLRRVHGRRRGGAGAGARLLRGGRLPLGRRGGQPPRLRRAGQPGGARAAGRRARAARLRVRERDLAQLLPDGREGAARGVPATPRPRRRRPTWSPTSRSHSCSTRWRSGSTARAPGRPTCGSTGSSPTPTRRTRSRSATASCATARAATSRGRGHARRRASGARRAAAENGRPRRTGSRGAGCGSRATAVKLGELLGLLDEPDPRFPIVTPRP